MFDLRLKPRVTITHKDGALYVRRVPKSKSKVVFALLPPTAFVAIFGLLIFSEEIRTESSILHSASILGLILIFYAVILRVTLGPLTRLEEIVVERGVLSWSRRLLGWTRTTQIPIAEITEIKAVTPWLNREGGWVECAVRKRRRIIAQGLLPSEAVELAKQLRHAAGLIAPSHSD